MHSAPIVQQSIRIEEPAGYRIIIPGLEIVEPCLLIVVIPPVAEGVILAQGILQASRYAYHPAPAIVHIADDLCPVFVRQGHHVPLQVAQGVVVYPIIIQSDELPSAVIIIIKCRTIPFFAQ